MILVGAPPLRAAAPPALAQILARAGEYVRRFQLEFAAIVSDEDYRQNVTSRQYSTPPPASLRDVERLLSTSRQRRTRSEMLFLWMPDETAWLTVRNVLTVDGRPVPDGQNRLNDALGDTSVGRRTRLRRLLNESARFNLGSIHRNLNFPTLALLFLDPALQSRFAFSSAGRERINGVETEKMKFDERSRPTFIQDDGTDLVSRGVMWVADADGAVARTRLELRVPLRETVASVDVDYRRDARLDMWVPSRMHETYVQNRASVRVESIDSVATYSNFRRFETSGRIIPPN